MAPASIEISQVLEQHFESASSILHIPVCGQSCKARILIILCAFQFTQAFMLDTN